VRMSEYTVNLELALEASPRTVKVREGTIEDRVDFSMRNWIDRTMEWLGTINPEPSRREVREIFHSRGVPDHVYRRIVLGVQ